MEIQLHLRWPRFLEKRVEGAMSLPQSFTLSVAQPTIIKERVEGLNREALVVPSPSLRVTALS